MAPKKTEETPFVSVMLLCRRCTRSTTSRVSPEDADARSVRNVQGYCECGTVWAQGSLIPDPSGFEARAALAERRVASLERQLEVANAKVETFEKVLKKDDYADRRDRELMFRRFGGWGPWSY